jgi:nucleotide-binding universal stress UspA family protein
MARKNVLLVPLDGSDNALRALAHAAKHFRRGGFGAIVALHVQTPLPSSRFVSRQMIKQHQERESEEAFRKARQLAARLKVPVRFESVCATPATAIIDFVRKGDEIVMGTRGLGRVGGLLLGSTAMKVVQLSPVPVTLVK